MVDFSQGTSILSLLSTSSGDHIMKATTPLLAGLLMTLASTSHATGAYAGLGLGESFVDQGVFGEMDTAYKVFGGMQLHPNLAVEVAYMDLGEPVEQLFGFRQEYDVWAVALWGKAILPVSERIELFGKLGVAYWEYDEVTRLGSLPPTSTSNSATDLAWGVGLAFAVTKQWSIPLEYEEISGDLDKAGLFSVSVAYHF